MPTDDAQDASPQLDWSAVSEDDWKELTADAQRRAELFSFDADYWDDGDGDAQESEPRHPFSLTQEECRKALEGLFITLPDDPSINYRSIFLALDAVHGRTSGQVSSRSFLLTHRSELGGHSPIEIIFAPDAADRIWRLVDVVVAEFS